MATTNKIVRDVGKVARKVFNTEPWYRRYIHGHTVQRSSYPLMGDDSPFLAWKDFFRLSSERASPEEVERRFAKHHIALNKLAMRFANEIRKAGIGLNLVSMEYSLSGSCLYARVYTKVS